MRTCTLLLGAVLVATSYVTTVFETFVDPNFSFANGLWSVAITMTTVGYGDAVPRTYAGRFFTMAAALTGVVFIAFLCAIIHAKLQLSPVQNQVISFLRHEAAKLKRKTSAVAIIQSAWRYSRSVRRWPVNKDQDHATIATNTRKRRRDEKRLLGRIVRWRNERRKVATQQTDSQSMLSQLLEKVYDEVYVLRRVMKKMNERVEHSYKRRKQKDLVRFLREKVEKKKDTIYNVVDKWRAKATRSSIRTGGALARSAARNLACPAAGIKYGRCKAVWGSFYTDDGQSRVSLEICRRSSTRPTAARSRRPCTAS